MVPSSTPWRLHSIAGWGLALLSAALWIIFAASQWTELKAPRPLDVATATAEIQGTETLEAVELTDLEIDCTRSALHGTRWYAAGHGAAGTTVLLELRGDHSCPEIAAAAEGHLRESFLGLDLIESLVDDIRPRDVYVLRPRRPEIWILLVPIPLAVLAGLILFAGRQIRRRRQPSDIEDEPESAGDPYRHESDARLLPRPLRADPVELRRGRIERLALWLLGVTLILGSIGWHAPGLWSLHEQREILERGVDGRFVEIGQESRTRLFVQEVDIIVRYTDATGEIHHGGVRMSSALVPIADRKKARVLYDPEHPERFAVLRISEAAGGAWILAVFAVLLIGGLGTAALREALARGRRAAELDELLRSDPEEVILTLQRALPVLHRGRPTGAMNYRLIAGDERTVIEELSPWPDRVLLLDEEQTRVLGLRHPRRPELLIVLHENLLPFDLPPGEAARIRRRFADRLPTDERST